MAMSDTGSSLANWYDDLYHYAPSPGLSLSAADSTTILASTATAAAPTSPASAGSGDGSPNRTAAGILGPQAAGKPSAARKRPARASRRAPVTLLNTDAANFRAMVQQFTGIPAHPVGPVINFRVPDYGFHQPLQPAPSMSFDHLHHHQLLQQQYTGAAFGYGYGNYPQQALACDGFGSAADRMLLQSMQEAQMAGAHTANNGAANGYFA